MKNEQSGVWGGKDGPEGGEGVELGGGVARC